MEYLVRMPDLTPPRVVERDAKPIVSGMATGMIDGESVILRLWVRHYSADRRQDRRFDWVFKDRRDYFAPRRDRDRNLHYKDEAQIMKDKKYQSPFERVVDLYKLDEEELSKVLFIRRSPAERGRYMRDALKNGLSSSRHIVEVWKFILDSPLPDEIKLAYNPIDALVFPDDQLKLRVSGSNGAGGKNYGVFSIQQRLNE